MCKVCGVLFIWYASLQLPTSIALYQRMFHKRDLAFGIVISWRFGGASRLDLEVADVSAAIVRCLLPLDCIDGMQLAIVCSTCCTSNFKLVSTRQGTMIQVQECRFQAERTQRRICKSCLAIDALICTILSSALLPLLPPAFMINSMQ